MQASRQDNKVKVFYGLLREPDLQNVQVDPEEDEGGTSADPSGSSASTPSGTAQKSDSGVPTSTSSSQGSTTPATGSSDQKPTPSKKKKGKRIGWYLRRVKTIRMHPRLHECRFQSFEMLTS